MTSRNKNIPWADVGLALTPLVPIAIAELLNGGRTSPVILPILLIGVIIGARRGWPRWSLWWLGWTLSVATLAMLLWLHSPGRPAMIYFLWELLAAVILLSTGVAIWQRGDGFRVAFTMFPCALEFVRFVFFDDLPQETGQSLLMRATTVLIYACVSARVVRQRSRRARWWTLIAGSSTYFIVAIVVSFPILLFFTMYPVYLPSTGVLVLGPLVVGLGLNGYQTRRRLSTLIHIALVIVITLSIIGLLLPWLAGDALPASPHAPVAAQAFGPRHTIIIDTDLSNDDYVAILYLLQRPDVDILGITVANGNVYVEPGIENIRRLLGLAGREDIPIAAGPSAPLVGDSAFPDFLRSGATLGPRLAFPKLGVTPASIPAPDLIRQLVADSSSPVTLIALGPLTNVAQALQDDPVLASQLGTVLFSGGMIYIESKDLTNPTYELDWNTFIDPYAADVVFRSGVPLALVPLDVTDTHSARSILINRSFVSCLETRSHSAESQLMVHFMKNWLLFSLGADATPLWDAPAAAIAVDPAICTEWRELSLRIAFEPSVELDGKILIEEGDQPNARVCLTGDQAAFEEAYLATAH